MPRHRKEGTITTLRNWHTYLFLAEKYQVEVKEQALRILTLMEFVVRCSLKMPLSLILLSHA